MGVVNLLGGGNRVDNSGWGITYTYIPHGGTLKEKYLVFQGVNMKVVSEPQQASVGLALTRWEHRSGKYRVTTLPVVRQSEYTERNRIAYLLTRPVVGIETLEVEECVNRQDPDDYLVTDAGGCDGSGHDRIATIGWVYKCPQKIRSLFIAVTLRLAKIIFYHRMQGVMIWEAWNGSLDMV